MLGRECQISWKNHPSPKRRQVTPIIHSLPRNRMAYLTHQNLVHWTPDSRKADYDTVEVTTRRTTARSVSTFVSWSSLVIKRIIAGIRNFVVGVTVRIASDETTLRRERTHLNKLNLALIQVRFDFSVSSRHIGLPHLFRSSNKNGHTIGLHLSQSSSNPPRQTYLSAKTTW
jgi:hypothetical protein